MRVHDAADSLQEIRQRLGVIDQRRPFRSVSIGFSGGLALVVPFVFLPELISLPDFLLIWFMVAMSSFGLLGVELFARIRNGNSRLNAQWIGDLFRKLVPTFGICFALTWAAISNPSLEKLLPPIWSIFYGLGLLTCGSLLPRTCLFAIGYLLFGGTIAIQSPALGTLPMSVQMALLFGLGQIGLFACLYFGVKNDAK